jgi:hypothetical protein
MPDLVQFSITRLANASVSIPRWTVAGRIVDSKTQQTVLQDFTGANAVTFPNVLGNLTAAQQDDFVQHVVLEILQKRFPAAF